MSHCSGLLHGTDNLLCTDQTLLISSVNGLNNSGGEIFWIILACTFVRQIIKNYIMYHAILSVYPLPCVIPRDISVEFLPSLCNTAWYIGRIPPSPSPKYQVIYTRPLSAAFDQKNPSFFFSKLPFQNLYSMLFLAQVGCRRWKRYKTLQYEHTYIRVSQFLTFSIITTFNIQLHFVRLFFH